MQKAKVIGKLWTSYACEALSGYKILILCEELRDGKKEYFLAVDTVDAGIGDEVLTVSGSAARVSKGTKGSPADTAIIAIIDKLDSK